MYSSIVFLFFNFLLLIYRNSLKHKAKIWKGASRKQGTIAKNCSHPGVWRGWNCPLSVYLFIYLILLRSSYDFLFWWVTFHLISYAKPIEALEKSSVLFVWGLICSSCSASSIYYHLSHSKINCRVMLLKDMLCVIWKRSAHLEPNIWSFTFVQTCTYALACYGSLDSSLMVCNVRYVWFI